MPWPSWAADLRPAVPKTSVGAPTRGHGTKRHAAHDEARGNRTPAAPRGAADADDAEPRRDVLSGYRSDDRDPRGARPFLIGLSRLSDELLRVSRNASPRQACRSRPRATALTSPCVPTPRQNHPLPTASPQPHRRPPASPHRPASPSPSLFSLFLSSDSLSPLLSHHHHLRSPSRLTSTPLLCANPHDNEGRVWTSDPGPHRDPHDGPMMRPEDSIHERPDASCGCGRVKRSSACRARR
jgi:hypothetical protein